MIDSEAERKSSNGTESTSGRPTLRVGCALLPKKIARYLTPHMLEVARASGIDFCVIDPSASLISQGPFDAIIHKLRPSQAWEDNVTDYLHQHPDVKLIDRVDGIKQLQNRATMLLPLCGGGVTVTPQQYERTSTGSPASVQAPLQVELHEGITLDQARQVLEAAGLHPPLLVKPLWTDGREGSHGLALLHDLQALGKILQGSISSELKPPLVVQQFVEHGGVLYKVYVLGVQTVVTRRPSLGDGHMSSSKAVQPLPRISCQRPGPGAGPPGQLGKEPPQQAVQPQLHPYRLSCGEQCSELAEACQDYPPDWLTDALATHLRQQLGLQLFNFDLICPEAQEDGSAVQYYIVDINYFPGVDKIPGFEQLFVDFVKATIEGEGWQPQPPPPPQQQQQPSADSSSSCGS